MEHGSGSGCYPPLLIIAGAGSGKTATLAARVARLVLDGADPQRILLLTFSRRAAQEMQRRVAGMLTQALRLPGGQAAPALPWSGTFHSIGARLLREYAPQLGLSEQFTVHDRGDSEDLLQLERQNLELGQQTQRFPGKATCLSIYSRVVNSGDPLDAVLKAHFPWCAAWTLELKRLFRGYVQAKQKQQVLDFDDLLLHWGHLMSELNLAAHVGARFDHVLVDEYQDTNRLQARILLALKPDGVGLTVVGDDAQAIYGFRAADVRNIREFPQAFAPSATVLPLTRNYRATQPILAASNAVIAAAAEGYCKPLWSDRSSSQRPRLQWVADEAAQAVAVAGQILELREDGLPLKAQAVLFRTAHHSLALELELSRRNIPYVKYGGLKFLEAAHVKDVLALLRWAENPRSRMAGFRVVRLVLGLGPASAQKLLDVLEQAADPAAALALWSPPPAARRDWPALALTIARLRDGNSWPADLEIALGWYLPQLPRLYEGADARAADLRQLQAMAGEHPSRERFLTELTLDPPSASSDHAGPPHLDDDYLVLSTIHSAKGQEWKSVHLLNVVDGCIPSEMSTGNSAEIEEERRLLYVAMTRAKDYLTLWVPQKFYVHNQVGQGDRHVYANVSRFLPPALHGHFEEVRPPTPAYPNGRPALPAARVDVMAQALSRWD